MKLKRIAPKLIILTLLGVLIFVYDHLYMAVTWNGIREVEIEFDTKLNELRPRVLRYTNESKEYLEQIVRTYTDDDRIALSDYPLPHEAIEKDDQQLLYSRGSGKRSTLRTYYEYWTDGYLAEIEIATGDRLLCWTESELVGDNHTATFTLNKSQPVGR